MMVITHDLAILYRVADSILVMYAGKLAGGAGRGDHRLAPSLHAAADLVAARVGVTYEEQGLTGIPGRPPPLLDPPRPAAGSRSRCPFAFEKCVDEPPFLEVAPGHEVACWKVF